jgi:dihydrodipicolinate synthase/N-acetylneuraminate lyase
MAKSYFISALGTPLDGDENLHHEGLRLHLDDQHSNGIDGVLVGGTMGMMQLLRDQTYRDLIKESCALWSGRGEMFVGVGDAGFARTRDRLRLVNEFPVDVTVVLAPYFMKFSQERLIEYYRALADESRSPLYLYDLPQSTGTVLSVDTVVTLSRHPNIRGIKCSGDIAQVRVLMDAAPADFRVIVAQPLITDVLLHHGIGEHLDGVFAMFPTWVKRMKEAVAADSWVDAAATSRWMGRVMPRIQQYGVMSAMTTLLNARGIPGNFAGGEGGGVGAERRGDESIASTHALSCPPPVAA